MVWVVYLLYLPISTPQLILGVMFEHGWVKLKENFVALGKMFLDTVFRFFVYILLIYIMQKVHKYSTNLYVSLNCTDESPATYHLDLIYSLDTSKIFDVFTSKTFKCDVLFQILTGSRIGPEYINSELHTMLSNFTKDCRACLN